MDAFDNPARNGMTGPERDGASNEASNRAVSGGEFLAAAANVTAAASTIPLAIQAILVPDASGRIVLPAGASIDDITISGTDLVITLPNGQVFVIPGGAVDVPAIVVDGDTVPASTVAQLLENLGELNPEAGVRSSGGNFADPEGPIQDAYALGDLLPYTQLAFPQPEDRELLPAVQDEEPTIVIVTPDQPAGIAAATASVSEAGLPARGNEPAGSNSAANSETTTGSIVYDAGDGLDSITINGTAITAVGQVITTPLGQLTITSLTPGNVGYSYTLTDNTNANNNLTDPFTVVVTDNVNAGEQIMQIVPLGDKLLIETRVTPRDIAFIKVGDPANVKVTAYDFSIYGGLNGKVVRVSADSIYDEVERQAYFTVVVETTNSYLTSNGRRLPITPGMLCDVEIVTGKKSVLSYLLKPVLKVSGSALTER
ncbi:adhesin transport system membrane fusion protein [Sphingopyxis sp. OAS728]|uniref:HlyD family efflux transporter periplasmic adaptor subunit n=1 Tax=Sphingopyxis sp. OAS728 TaxID=2663823 RepID=UPI0019FF0CE5|nr:HlyD family efflux transporter periplasmic adaptor subunit [Sphingopyxis sp. OAS728]MBE1528498.1 adhesin transport system membrane fusion protein [Sphingopyxis sp. OAS728]